MTPKFNWYDRKDGQDKLTILKVGRYKVLQIRRKGKKQYNQEYTFYSCLVFKKGEVVASEGIHGSSLRKKYQAIRWGLNKARELNIIPNIHQFKSI